MGSLSVNLFILNCVCMLNLALNLILPQSEFYFHLFSVQIVFEASKIVPKSLFIAPVLDLVFFSSDMCKSIG